MSTQLIGLLAETFIHVGGGQSEGVVDLPVVREAVTDFPYFPGSGLKGALRDWASRHGVPDLETLFGKQENAGQLLVADARLLALPVRSLHDACRWVTCPHLWERYRRDARRLGRNVPELAALPHPGKALGQGEGRVVLEERGFELEGGLPDTVIKELACLLLYMETQCRLRTSLMLLHDDDFVWFARYGLAVHARNVLDDENKTSRNLWYEESLPPDSLLYTLLGERSEGKLQALINALANTPYLQVGGNETVGQGWLALKIVEEAA